VESHANPNADINERHSAGMPQSCGSPSATACRPTHPPRAMHRPPDASRACAG